MRDFKFRTAPVILGLALMPAGAFAQSTPDVPPQGPDPVSKNFDHKNPPVADIIVTASKSGNQRLLKVPMAIQAFRGEDLRERNINNVDDLISSVPGIVDNQNVSAASKSYSIRGVGAASGTNGDPAVSYYVDDVPFSVINFGIAPQVRFFDLDRVEVLRGPQGTLYGQGAAGGVFIFHTRDPDLTKIQASIEATTSATKGASGLNYGGAGMVSVPLIKDKLAVRVSGGYSKNQGYAAVYYGPYNGKPDIRNANRILNSDIRVVALWKPADNINIRAQYWNFNPRQNLVSSLNSLTPAYVTDTQGLPFFGNGAFKLYSLTGNIDLGAIAVTSATAWMNGTFGLQGPFPGALIFSSQMHPRNFSQEMRINSTSSGPLHWIVGGQYQNAQGKQINGLLLPDYTKVANFDNNTITKNWAAFGEISYSLFSGKILPLAGFRYFHDNRTFADSNSSALTKSNVPTYRVNLSYLPNENVTTFVTVSTGWRPGIVQSQLQVSALSADGIPAQLQLKPEKITNYEVGVKWRSPGGSLTGGVNAYIIKMKDIQSSIITSSGTGGYSSFGDGTTKGLDLDLHWRTPVTGLSINAVGNMNTGHYDKVDPIVQLRNPLLRPGARLVNSTLNNYRVDANYSQNLDGNITAFANIALSGSGNYYQSSGAYTKAYRLASATLGARRGPYELALVADNVFNYRGATILGAVPNSGVAPTPRTIGIRFRANYQ